MWDLIVSVPDHCLSFYLAVRVPRKFTHKKNVASLTYDSREARTSAGGITSNIHVST